MDLSTITVSDFKQQFPRDFPYLPTWVAGTYNTGDRVYYAVTSLFYDANLDGVTSTPDTSADWVTVNDSAELYIQDSDIERAFAEAEMNLNQALFSSDAEITITYLYLTAHYLAHDFKQWTQNLNSSGQGSLASRSVGNVSESYAIPKEWTDSVIYNFYTTSLYGVKYLSFVTNRISGNFGIAYGCTQA